MLAVFSASEGSCRDTISLIQTQQSQVPFSEELGLIAAIIRILRVDVGEYNGIGGFKTCQISWQGLAVVSYNVERLVKCQTSGNFVRRFANGGGDVIIKTRLYRRYS